MSFNFIKLLDKKLEEDQIFLNNINELCESVDNENHVLLESATQFLAKFKDLLVKGNKIPDKPDNVINFLAALRVLANDKYRETIANDPDTKTIIPSIKQALNDAGQDKTLNQKIINITKTAAPSKFDQAVKQIMSAQQDDMARKELILTVGKMMDALGRAQTASPKTANKDQKTDISAWFK